MREPDDSAHAAIERLLSLVGEADARQILADLARPAVLAEFERVVIRRMAVRLLGTAPRPIVRDRLRAAHGISERKAYRVIGEALGLGPRRSAREGGALADEPQKLLVPQLTEKGDGQ